MLLFIASETMFFGGLFGTYFTLRTTASPWPGRGISLAMPEPIAMTVVLLLSSIPAHGAMRALRRHDFEAVQRRLVLTMLMGAAFLGLKVDDWATAGFTIASHVYGTVFYALTGFHALHMLVGLALLGGVAVKASLGAYRGGPEAEAGPEAAVYYWHFVDAVRAGVFSTIYLIR